MGYAEVIDIEQARARRELRSEPWVTGAFLAAHFGVTVRTVRRWRGQGMPSSKNRTGARRYKVSLCEEWRDRQ